MSHSFDHLDELNETRDLSLPDWGPYGKRHWAIAHIADQERGTLFECVPIPGLFSKRVYYPMRRGGGVDWTPLDATADLSLFGWRCLMDAGTRADMRVFDGGESVRLWETTFHNERENPVNFMLDFMLGFQSEGERVAMRPDRGIAFLGAHRYDRLNVSLSETVIDQKREGVVAAPCYIERVGLGPAFTQITGATASYTGPATARAARLGIRYALSGTTSVKVQVRVNGARRTVTLRPTGEGPSFDTFAIAWMPLRTSDKGSALEFTVLSPSSDGELCVDGFFFAPADREPELTCISGEANLKTTVTDDMILIESPLARGKAYGVLVQAEPKLFTWRVNVADHLSYNHLRGSTSRFWLRERKEGCDDTLYGDLRPLTCPAQGALSVRCAVAFADSPAALKRRLRSAMRNWNGSVTRVQKQHAATRYVSPVAQYRQGLESVMTATLTSLAYPQDFLREYVRHFGPGAYYPTLYLWDAGMQGLALVDHAPKLALEGLNTYLQHDDLPHMPVILHGTALPTHPYLYWELFERTGDRAMLAALYPKMRAYYRFFAGKDGSLMDSFGTGLLNPWHYFYNSAGWDDYPPQEYVDRGQIGPTLSPVANTAHAIRGGRIMALAALELGHEVDVAEYRADMDRMTAALLKHSWDDRSGYFSYVFDKGKRKLEYRRGVNFNMGLDGVSPLVGGGIPKEIAARLIAHCKDPKRLWSRYGLSTVDQSAPYYDKGGYWNGGVWVAHQWFMFKALLDHGEARFAVNVADAILSAWHNAVVAARGQTFEAINIADGQAYGTPYFSALSAPVIPLAHSCYATGRVTSGFDTRIADVAHDEKAGCLTARVWRPLGAGASGFVVVPGRPGAYRCGIGGRSKRVVADGEGRLIFSADVPSDPTPLRIEPTG